MTSKNLEKLYDLQSELSNLITDLKAHPEIKSRSGALVLTKLDEARFWLHDLIKEVGDREDAHHSNNELTLNPVDVGVSAGHLQSGSD